jgi:hypothetical protein
MRTREADGASPASDFLDGNAPLILICTCSGRDRAGTTPPDSINALTLS